MRNLPERLIRNIGRRIVGEIWYARRLGVTVGEKCSLFRIIYGSEPWLITIGNHVQITDGVRLLTHGGGWLLRDQFPGFDSFGPLLIGNNVYIGNDAILLPGVRVGNRVLIAAGTVVAKSIPDGVVVGGNPGRIICSIDEYVERNAQYDMGTAGMNGARKKQIVLASPDRWIRKARLKP